MILFKKAQALSLFIAQKKKEGSKTGFVPTMGALHTGHLSLVEASKKENDLSICSIFVNPTQFNNPDDFNRYPVTIETDIEKLITAGCDVLFLPSKEEIYPLGYTAKKFELGNLETVLEGYFRPGHFQGVCQVMERLLAIVDADNLYLGAKDYQQCKVITKLIFLMGKQNSLAINIEPTLREPDGLAMSSRNLRLAPEQRKAAPEIYETLRFVKTNFHSESIRQLEKEGTELLTNNGFKVDYLQIADAGTLLPALEQTPAKIILVAAFIDTIRLIDNLPLN